MCFWVSFLFSRFSVLMWVFFLNPSSGFFLILGIFALRLIFSRKLIRSSTFEFHFVRAFYFGLLCHSEVCGVVLANFGMGLDSFSSLFLSFPFDTWFSRFILGFLGCFSVFLLFWIWLKFSLCVYFCRNGIFCVSDGHFIVFWILARLCALFRPYFGSCCVCLSSRFGFSFFFVCFIFFLVWVFLCVVGFLGCLSVFYVLFGFSVFWLILYCFRGLDISFVLCFWFFHCLVFSCWFWFPWLFVGFLSVYSVFFATLLDLILCVCRYLDFCFNWSWWGRGVVLECSFSVCFLLFLFYVFD